MVTNCVPTSPYASGLGQTKPQSHNVTVDQQFKQCSSQPRHATWLSNCLEVLYQAIRAVRSVGDAWRGMARFAAVGLAAVRWAWYAALHTLAGRSERLGSGILELKSPLLARPVCASCFHAFLLSSSHQYDTDGLLGCLVLRLILHIRSR